MKIKNSLAPILLSLIAGCGEFEDRGTDSADQSMMRVAEKMRVQEDNQTAATIYMKLLAKNPDNTQARIKLADLMRDEGHYAEAVAELAKIPKGHSQYDNAQLQIAVCQIEANEPEKGKIVLAKMLGNNNARAYNLMGVCDDMLGMHQAAQQSYHKALQKDPDYLGARSNLGLSLALDGKTQEAVTVLNEVNRNPRSSARDRQNLAVAHALAKNPAEAEKLFQADMSPETARSNVDFISAYESPD